MANLQKFEPLGEKDLVKFSNIAATAIKSGMFKDIKDTSSAIMKMIAGHSMGLPEFVSLRGIEILCGQVTLKPILMAGLIKSSTKYNYYIHDSTDKICRIEFFEHGKSQGFSQFTIEEAKQAGLIRNDSGWTKYPTDMLYNRAMGRGSRKYCPDVSMFPIYVEGEIIDEQPIKMPEATASQNEIQLTTQDQRVSIFAKMNGLKISKDDMAEYIFRKYGVDSSKKLTYKQGEEIKNVLKEENQTHAFMEYLEIERAKEAAKLMVDENFEIPEIEFDEVQND